MDPDLLCALVLGFITNAIGKYKGECLAIVVACYMVGPVQAVA